MATDPATFEPLPVPEGPPVERLTAGRWVRENLFSGRFNTTVTIVFGALLGYAAYRGVRFLFWTGRWEVVSLNLTNYMVGTFPRDELWRPWLALYLLVAVISLRWGVGVALRIREGEDPRRTRSLREPVRRLWPIMLFAVVIMVLSQAPVTIAAVLGIGVTTAGGRLLGMILPRSVTRWVPLILIGGVIVAFEVIVTGVGFGRWAGLLLTMFFAVGGIVISFPLGVLLALGRRSSLPGIRMLSVAYIELIRGVPLVTLLFMSFLLIGFFLPPGSRTPTVETRALIAFIMFTAAYIAEIVRGGLQAVPKGQYEAAQALGLSPIRIMGWIILPQALRAVIPGLVGQFISLFKDTSLAGFIALTELLEVARGVLAQPAFRGQGLQAESLLFASFIYWAGAYWMSRSSQRLERRLGVGER